MRKRLAAVALAGVFLLGACGDGDDETGSGNDGGGILDDGGGSGDSGGGDSGGGDSGGGDSGGGGYPDQVRSNFIDSCTSSGGTQEQCECAFDHVSSALSYEDFQAYEQAVRENPSNPPRPPDAIVESMTECTVPG